MKSKLSLMVCLLLVFSIRGATQESVTKKDIALKGGRLLFKSSKLILKTLGAAYVTYMITKDIDAEEWDEYEIGLLALSLYPISSSMYQDAKELTQMINTYRKQD